MTSRIPPEKLFGGMVPTALQWEPLPYMDEFLLQLEADGRTEAYRKAVKVGLSHLANYMREEENVRHPDEITRAMILRFQVALSKRVSEKSGEPLSVPYRQQLMKYARVWINWLEEIEHIERNPWVRIRVGNATKKPKPLEEDEVASLFASHTQQAFAIPPFYYHRREVALVLLLGWGLRLHELAALDASALDARLNFVTTRNKGGRAKQLPYTPEIKQIVQRYLTHRARHARHDSPALMIDQSGRALSGDTIYRIIKELGDRAGVAINPHRLRDTFGTAMLDGDVPVERIMKMMGHTDRKQTLAYARVNDPKVYESHDSVMTPLLKTLLQSQRLPMGPALRTTVEEAQAREAQDGET